MKRPHVLLSVAVSLDGYIDDTSDDRLLLSNSIDFDRVDEVRAGVDAILIGAQTMRSDNPRLLVNSAERRATRISQGRSEFPTKVTVSASGNLDRGLKFWHFGGKKIVYTVEGEPFDRLTTDLAGLADIVSVGAESVDFGAMLDDLASRGVERIMVEGGGHIHTEFLSRGLADELHLAIAPILVGDSNAPRFLYDAKFDTGRMRLIESRNVGDVVLVRYAPKDVTT